jgi:L-lactate utilization protein LutB
MKIEYIAKYFDDLDDAISPVRFKVIVAETDDEARKIAADHMKNGERKVVFGQWQGVGQVIKR